MKQFASHSEEDIPVKRQNIVHINTIISNKAATNLLKSYLKEKDMETNFEMFDVARLAETLPHFYVNAVTKSGNFYKTTTLTQKEEI
jgi:phosphoribosylaminoimidazole-succinocarboxamide synthase